CRSAAPTTSTRPRRSPERAGVCPKGPLSPGADLCYPRRHLPERENTMRVTAAVLYDVNEPYAVETVELDPPKRGEVLIKVGAAGVCRSDLHFQKGEASIALPAVLGHE